MGLLKKGEAKQSRIKSIMWHLRWLIRKIADISLRPSGSVRPRTYNKMRPRPLIRARIDIKFSSIGSIGSEGFQLFTK